ncbi:MAG: hypothetical protein ACF8MJ_09865 [Phycisphaerales bacterium JB050]
MDQKDDNREPVPLGVARDDAPPPKPSRAATNDAEDRRKALILIGVLLGVVLLLVILGNTVLRPAILAQRERMLIRVTQDQTQEFVDLAQRYYLSKGRAPGGFDDLSDIERLETSKGIDLWGNPFVFSTVDRETGERTILIRSAGPDGEFETNDDITAQGELIEQSGD